MVRDYRDRHDKWINASVSEKLGPLSYKVKTEENGLWRRHADQMTKTAVESKTPELVPDVSDSIVERDVNPTIRDSQPKSVERLTY